jgi:phenylacetate-CoA ligase
MKLIEIIYYNSPVFMQNIFTSMYGIKLYSERYGKIYNQYLDELLESQWFSEEKLQELQLEKLKTMLTHCQTNVPYYQNLFKKINFNPDKMKNISELGKLSIITKNIVIARYNEFLANNYNNKNTVIVNTSGSTGTPLRLVISKDGRKYNYAFFQDLKHG